MTKLKFLRNVLIHHVKNETQQSDIDIAEIEEGSALDNTMLDDSRTVKLLFTVIYVDFDDMKIRFEFLKIFFITNPLSLLEKGNKQ